MSSRSWEVASSCPLIVGGVQPLPSPELARKTKRHVPRGRRAAADPRIDPTQISRVPRESEAVSEGRPGLRQRLCHFPLISPRRSLGAAHYRLVAKGARDGRSIPEAQRRSGRAGPAAAPRRPWAPHSRTRALPARRRGRLRGSGSGSGPRSRLAATAAAPSYHCATQPLRTSCAPLASNRLASRAADLPATFHRRRRRRRQRQRRRQRRHRHHHHHQRHRYHRQPHRPHRPHRPRRPRRPRRSTRTPTRDASVATPVLSGCAAAGAPGPPKIPLIGPGAAARLWPRACGPGRD
jgi:hypothetical protein